MVGAAHVGKLAEAFHFKTRRSFGLNGRDRISVARRKNRTGSQTFALMNGTANGTASAEIHHDVEKILFSAKSISERSSKLGSDIAHDYKNKRPLLVAALNGAFMFLSDLSRSIQPPPEGMQLDFVNASSYIGKSTSASKGDVKFSSLQQSKIDVKDRHVIIVEDIVDSGFTALKLKQRMLENGATSVKLVALLDKSERRSCDLQIDYCAFWCPDEFVVGYGMDFNEQYRCLPYVGVLKPELYQ